MKARDNLSDDIWKIMVIPFDFDDGVDDTEVLSQYLRILFDFLFMINTAGPHVFEATVIGVVFVDDKMEDILDVEDVETVLNFLQIEPFDKVEIVLKHWYL